jgi:hypothetical protein
VSSSPPGEKEKMARNQGDVTHGEVKGELGLENATSESLNGTAPHAESREMVTIRVAG